MDKNLKKFMATETRSRAQILDRYFVEVQTPDGELFKIMSDIAKYDSDEYKAYWTLVTGRPSEFALASASKNSVRAKKWKRVIWHSSPALMLPTFPA